MCCTSYAQEKVFLTLQSPLKDKITVSTSPQFITGRTCKNCMLTANGKPVKVYSTGAFALEVALKADTSIQLLATLKNKTIEKNIQYFYQARIAPQPVSTFSIESIQTLPEGDLYLLPGEQINIIVKALPGCRMVADDTYQLYEQGNLGLYKGVYTITDTVAFSNRKIKLKLYSPAGDSLIRETKNYFGIFNISNSPLLLTKGRLAHLKFGLGEDRLGGAKIGYIDSNIILQPTGIFGDNIRVKLAFDKSAYIEKQLVDSAPKGTFPPASLTGDIIVTGDSVYDYVQVNLQQRLPYQSIQLTSPAKLVIDIFGATSNTNWIKQFQSARGIEAVDYVQERDGVFRIILSLKSKLHWGHQIFYKGNSLLIKIKRPPPRDISKLTIAVDAGHGGSNTGAAGIGGSIEKNVTLILSGLLQKALEKEGAKVIMTRNAETFFDNKERILFYRDSMPDLLLSIHLNSSADPVNVGGTSTYYRHIGFKPLSAAIYKRLLELGLKEYGNTGAFNFMLNSPTEYPNALVETVFISNPAEEEKILDASFQQQMVDKIVMGIKDYLLLE